MTHELAEDRPRPSATVVLLRDAPQGLEVLMQRRSDRASQYAGLYVFPGGKLEAHDSDTVWQHRLDLDGAQLLERLAEPDSTAALAQGLHVAALRETFEEAGILLVESTGAAPAAASLATVQHALLAGRPWTEALQSAELRWHTRALLPWSRWITPRHMQPRKMRFDARFFLARLPPGQQVQQDGHEAVESIWITPRQALGRFAQRDIRLLPPQIMSLIELMDYADTDTLWATTLERRPPLIEPVHVTTDSGVVVCYPGDPDHPVQERHLPGPTRMRVTPECFEPLGGFGGWLTTLENTR